MFALMESEGFLMQGTSFGELALQYEPHIPEKVIKRAATIKTVTPSIFAVMNKENYKKVLQNIDMKREELIISFFK